MYQHIAANKRKSWLVVVCFFAFLTLVLYVFAQALGYGADALGIAAIIAFGSTFFSYWFSDSMVLTLSGARPASRKEDFLFYTVTENLCLAARLPMPKLYVIDDTAMNAFATGRDPKHASICATTGLLSRLDRTELEGVVAHELAHVKNYDIRLMAVISVMVGLIALLADWFLRFGLRGRRQSDRESGGLQAALFVLGVVLALLSPLIAQLMQLAISRSREYLADASGAKLTQYPEGLARALEKLDHDREPLEAANKATAHLYITNPLKNRHDAVGWFAGLFTTHPPIAERVARLRDM